MIFIFIFLFFIHTSYGLAPTEQYPQSKTLISPDLLSLYWKFDLSEITFEIHYKYSEWAMFGISNSLFSDVIMVWLNEDKTGHFSDRKLLSNNQLEFDREQNWLPIDAFKKDDVTVFKFKRTIEVSCKNDSTEDLNLLPGLISVVFSTGNTSNPQSITEPNRVEIELLPKNSGPYNCPLHNPLPILTSSPTDLYTNSFDLIPGIYKIYWNYSSTEIIAEIHCKTNGWVGFGFSPTGGMDKSDVVVGWISNGQVNFTDRHIVGRDVKIDQKQDWVLLKSSEMNDITIFKFKRNIILCDPEDFTIEKGSPYVIFAYGERDPMPGSDIYYHSLNKGSARINFITSSDEVQNNQEKDTETLDITISNLILPKQDTYYYCKGFRVPKTLTQKRHIYKYEFIFSNINYKSMHHALLYECNPGYDGETPKYQDGECYSSSVKGQYCKAISIGWAVGGAKLFNYPQDTGYPIGGDTDYSYLVLELHYDNPQLDIGFVDKAILRFYMTKNLKMHELGVLTLGSDSSPLGLSIPPAMNRFSVKTYCYNDCLNQKLKDQNLNIISATPHTHLAGLAVSTKIIRKGVDIGYLFRNKYYDFNFQNNYLLNPGVSITKDDELITECVYKTNDRTGFTFGGMSTRQEMCYHFLTYYPRRNDLKGCVSFPAYEDYIELFINLNKTENLNLKPLNQNDIGSWFQEAFFTTFAELNKKTVSEKVREMFTAFYDNTRIRYICNDYNDKILNQTKVKNVYEESDPCKVPPVPPNNITNTIGNFVKQIFNYIYNSISNFFRKIFN